MMFTGIIEAVGEVENLARRRGNLLVTIHAPWPLAAGASIAVDGACLTVVDGGERFTAEATSETLALTTLEALRVGTRVNLERALPAGGRLGGHFVTGHVDGRGRVGRIVKRSGYWVIEIDIDPRHRLLVVEKGSVAVDGISLTVAAVSDRSFTVNVIPFTLEQTTLGSRHPGDQVNIEYDILAKYAQRDRAAPA